MGAWPQADDDRHNKDMDEMSKAPQHPLARRTLAASAVLACLLLTACATQTAGLNAPQAGNAQVPGQFQYAAAPAGTARAVALDEAWW